MRPQAERVDLASVGRRLDPDHRRTTDGLITAALRELDVRHDRLDEGAFLAALPGRDREETLVWLVAGDHGLLVESLFLRAPVHRREAVLAALLARNARSRTVAFALDAIGDVFLLGCLPYAAVATPVTMLAEVDAALGQVLAHVDEAWLQVAEVGFGPRAPQEKWGEPGAGRRARGTGHRLPEPEPEPRR